MLTATILIGLLALEPEGTQATTATDAPTSGPTELTEEAATTTDVDGPAYAEELETLPVDQQDVDEAFTLFKSGHAAFGEQRFAEAIEFFAEAYRHAPRANLLYSVGQAHKKLYEAELDPKQRRFAILRYAQYLQVAPTGEFAVDVSRYMTSLMAQAELAVPVNSAPVTRIMVSTSVENAWMQIDDGEKMPAPGVAFVEPGRRRVAVGAEGHATTTRTIEATEGALSVVDSELPVLPAELVIRGPKGATVSVDGRRVGRLPLGRTVVVAPGIHFVAVTRNGDAAYTRQLEVGPDETVRVDATLRKSTQRILSYSMLGAGGASLIASAVTLGLSLDAQAEAKDLENAVGLQGEGYQRYLDQIERRNGFRATSIATGAVGAGLLVTGAVLFVLDRPQIEVPLYDRQRNAANRKGATLTVAVRPGIGGLRLRF